MTGLRINGNGIAPGPRGVYDDLLEAIEAMRVGDPPLRWDLPKEKQYSLRTRVSQMSTHKLWIRWHNGQIWVVRYE